MEVVKEDFSCRAKRNNCRCAIGQISIRDSINPHSRRLHTPKPGSDLLTAIDDLQTCEPVFSRILFSLTFIGRRKGPERRKRSRLSRLARRLFLYVPSIFPARRRALTAIVIRRTTFLSSQPQTVQEPRVHEECEPPRQEPEGGAHAGA